MNYMWVYLSLIVMILSALSVIILKILKDTNIDILMLLAIGYILTGICFLIYILKNFNVFKITINKLSLIILFLLLAFFIFHICSQQLMAMALSTSPNTGLCHLIINTNVILTLIISFFLFKEKINFKTFLGIVVTFIGITLVIYSSDQS